MENIIDIQTLVHSAMVHVGISLALWLLVIMAILLDLMDGVYTAKKCGKRIHSHKLRVTVAKIGEYWRLMMIGFIIDTIGILFPIYAYPYLSIVICIGLVGVEGKSMWEHVKERKSGAEMLTNIYKAIIECASKKDAKKALELICQYLDSEKP